MSEYQKLREIIKLHDNAWIDAYLDLVKEVLGKYGFSNEDARIGMTVRKKDNKLPLNIGKRWVISALPDGKLELILGADKKAEDYNCEPVAPGTANGEVQCIWVRYPFTGVLPPALKAAWLDAVDEEVRRGHKSPYKKFHSTLFYDVVMDADTRKEILTIKEGIEV